MKIPLDTKTVFCKEPLPVPEGKDVLVHFSQVKQGSEGGFKSLQEGSRVEYDVEVDPRDSSKFKVLGIF